MYVILNNHMLITEDTVIEHHNLNLAMPAKTNRCLCEDTNDIVQRNKSHPAPSANVLPARTEQGEGKALEPSDESLVLACRRGDEAAWETLVKRYQRLIHAIPRRAGLDAELAADVFQSVFTALLEHLDQIEQPARIRTWLVTTTQRETWRVSKRARMTDTPIDNDDDRTLDDMPDDTLLPEEVLVRTESQHAVRLAVESLDERCHKLLTMLFYRTNPPSYTEIAKMLGTSEGSIGPTRARCLQKLRQLLENLGVMFVALLVTAQFLVANKFHIGASLILNL